MQFNIWQTFSKRKGSIVNSRHIGNKVTHFQTTLGAGTYAFLDQTSRLKQTFEDKTKLKFNHVDIYIYIYIYIYININLVQTWDNSRTSPPPVQTKSTQMQGL